MIGIPVSDCNIPTPNSGETACFSFYRSSALTDNSFIELTNFLTGQSFTGATAARTYLENILGYYTSYPKTPLAVNDFYQGGVIGYIFQPGEPRYVSGETHGIIVSTETYGTRVQAGGGTGYTWGCSGNVTGLSETVGSGYTNQELILDWINTNCVSSAVTSTGFYLATGLTDNGYSDWYIGSFNEYNTVFSGTGAQNLPNYYPGPWSDTGQSYLSSTEITSSTFRFAVFDPNYATYRPPGTFNGQKDGSLNSSINVKPLRYF